MHLKAFERQRWRRIADDLGGYRYAQFERDVTDGRISIDELLTSGKRRRRFPVKPVQPPPPLPPREVILSRLREISPYREPYRLPRYQSEPDSTHWEGYRLKCQFWRKRVDVWLMLNGKYRPPRVLNDVSRAQALARLEALVAEREERVG